MTKPENREARTQAGCYAVIFTSRLGTVDPDYEKTAQRMLDLASGQPGYLGVESARGWDGFGITVSYWKDLDAIRRWQKHAEHQAAQTRGKAQWYESYQVRICRIERAYGFSNGRSSITS